MSGGKAVDLVERVQFGITEITEMVQMKRTEGTIPWADRLPKRMNSKSCSRASSLNYITHFFTAISFPPMNPLHRCLEAKETRRLLLKSMTVTMRRRAKVGSCLVTALRGHVDIANSPLIAIASR